MVARVAAQRAAALLLAVLVIYFWPAEGVPRLDAICVHIGAHLVGASMAIVAWAMTTIVAVGLFILSCMSALGLLMEQYLFNIDEYVKALANSTADEWYPITNKYDLMLVDYTELLREFFLRFAPYLPGHK